MPSLTDLANDINNTLTQIQTNTLNAANTDAAIKTDTGDMRNSLHTLITVDQTGFVSLSNGIAAMIDQQKATNALLDYERKQNDTIICWLTNIANVLCESLHTQQQQLAVQTAMERSLDEMKEIMELVNGTAAVEVLRRRELEQKINACCPPKKPQPGPCFEPCHEPGFVPYKPQVPDYKPLPQPNTPGQPK